MKCNKIFLFSLLLLVAAGCGDASYRRNGGGQGGSDGKALLRVNGDDLTAGYIREKVELAFAKSMVASGGKQRKVSPRAYNAFAMQNFKNYVTDFLLLQDARKKAVVVEAGDVSNALSRLNAATGKKFQTIEAFEPSFSQYYGMLKRDFEDQSLTMAYLRVEEGLSEVTDEDIDAYYIFWEKQNARDDKEDREQRKKAAAAAAALKGGMTWKDAVDQYSEDHLDNREEYGEDWGTWSLETVPFKQMAERMVRLPIGGTSEPFETEDGLVILRLMDKPEEGRFHLGRILVRLTDRAPRPSRAEVADILMDGKVVGAINSAKRRLEKTLRFEYPMGSNFAYKVWQEPPPKAKPAKRSANTNVVNNTKGESK